MLAHIPHSDNDFNRLKEDDTHTYSADTSYLLADETAMGDMMNPPNRLREISDSSMGDSQSPIRVTNYTADMSAPSLVQYDLDLDQGNLTLTFSEPVDVSTLDVTGIALYGVQDGGQDDLESAVNLDSMISLTSDSFSTSRDHEVIQVAIRGADLDNIKLSDDVGTGTGYADTYLSIESGSVYDTATYDEDGTFRQNAVEEVNYISAYSVTNFTQDSTAPALTSFELDMDAGELILNFDEPVRASTLNASRCEILSTGDYNETNKVDQVLRKHQLKQVYFFLRLLCSTNLQDA